jgi:PAT family beta-lactamase induction signal transducer AmpG
MNLSRNLRLALFSGLYLAQGAVMSYFLTFNIVYLGQAGYGPDDIGIFQAILVVPFILKILLGMLSDGVNLFGLGHRKPYILIGLLTQGLVVFLAPQIPVAEGLELFALTLLLAATGMALYDTCTDGLALDTTPETERGLVQGLMNGARAAGILVMLLAGGWLVDNLGWRWYFYSIVILTLLPLPLVLMIREDPTQTRRQKFQWSAFKALGQGAVILLALMGFVQTLALDGVLTFLSDHLRAVLQVSVGNIGLLVALSMVGRILGAISNTWITDRVGHKPSLLVAIVLSFAAMFGLFLGGGITGIAIFGLVFGLAYGYFMAVYAAVAMDFSNPHILASMFAIFMMFVNIGTAGGQVMGGMLTERFGFNQMALILGIISLLNIPLVFGIFRRRREPETSQTPS